MRRLAIIGASYLQLPLIERAKEMGLETHVFAWRANDVGEIAADYFYPISIRDKEQILKTCREIGICGICSIGSDLAVITVNYVAANLGLVGNSLESTLVSTNKRLMRRALRDAGNPCPWFIEVEESDIKPSLVGLVGFPVIVKATDRSGNRGVSLVNQLDELHDAVEYAIGESFEKKAIIEEYVEGKEYSVEYISYRGKHYFLALTEKFNTGAPYFVERRHRQPADIGDECLEKIKKITEHALTTLGIENGASHTELKISVAGEIVIIEIGARMGGDLIGSDLVKLSTGYDFVESVIRIACGEEIVKPQLVSSGETYESVYILNERDREEYRDILEKIPERIIRIGFMNNNVTGIIKDSSERIGCYIMRSSNC